MSESGWYVHDSHDGDVLEMADAPRFRIFAHHFSREQLERIHRYTHWIPAARGYTQQMMTTFFPGHSYNSLLEVFRVAGISIPSKVGGVMSVDPRVAAMHFTSPESLAVQFFSPDDSLMIPTVGWTRRGDPVDITSAFEVCTTCGRLRSEGCPFPTGSRLNLSTPADATPHRQTRRDHCLCDAPKRLPVTGRTRCMLCVVCCIEVVQGHGVRHPLCPMCMRWARRMRGERRPDPGLPNEISKAEMEAFVARLAARAPLVPDLCRQFGLADSPTVPLETYLDRARSEGLRHSTFRDISFGPSWRS
jgi:hypothetical protein